MHDGSVPTLPEVPSAAVGYGLAKDKKDKRLTDEFFLGCTEKIGNSIAKEENRVRGGIGAPPFTPSLEHAVTRH